MKASMSTALTSQGTLAAVPPGMLASGELNSQTDFPKKLTFMDRSPRSSVLLICLSALSATTDQLVILLKFSSVLAPSFQVLALPLLFTMT